MTDFQPEGTIKRGPGRPPRSEQPRTDAVQGQRRRRQDTGENGALKLYVDPRAKDPNYEHHIFNDSPGRIYQKTIADDWDIVMQDQMNGHYDPSRSVGEGTGVSFPVDQGNGRRGLLCRKPKNLYQQDKAKEQAAIRAQEDEMRRGPIADPKGIASSESYVPAGGISITHGR